MDKKKTQFVILISLIFLFVLTVVSLAIGQYQISTREIFSLIFTNNVKPLTKSVFLNLRLPRVLMALISGAGLSLAGAIYQTIFHNQLASPDIIGVSSGANLGAAVFITILSSSIIPTALGAFIGALLSVLLVLLLVKGTRESNTSTYVLAGIVISSAAKTGIMLLKYFADSESELAAIEYWTMGSLSSITATKLLYIAPFSIISIVILLIFNRQIQLLSLSDDEALSLGVNLKVIRMIILFVSTLLVSSIVSITGLISFIGLISPHIAYLVLKRKNKSYLVLSMITGALLLVLSDILARTISSSEIPISILTTIMGLPVLIALMLRKKGERDE